MLERFLRDVVVCTELDQPLPSAARARTLIAYLIENYKTADSRASDYLAAACKRAGTRVPTASALEILMRSHKTSALSREIGLTSTSRGNPGTAKALRGKSTRSRLSADAKVELLMQLDAGVSAKKLAGQFAITVKRVRQIERKDLEKYRHEQQEAERLLRPVKSP
jgi:hypothetical protein